MSLANRTIALAEGRQLEELVQILEKEGAIALRCPMLSILDAPDDGPILAWLDRLQAGAFDWVILLTGEGLRRLLGCADRHGRRDAVVAALRKTRTLIRGPKPGRALREIGLTATLTASAPTTDGVIESLRTLNLQGLTIGVQLYNESNQPLEKYLRDAGATPITVQPYVYAPAADTERVGQLLQQMADGKVDAIVFTSSPQIDRLFEVAEERQATALLMQGLAKTLVAAVGPIVQENLQKRGVTVQVCPEQGFVMKNLVQQLKRVMEAGTQMFQRVDLQHAGPSALGVLIPQGAKMPVIVRPRALPWDLLPARWDGIASHSPQFCIFTRDEAAGVARRLVQALETGVSPLESFGNAEKNCLQLWLRADDFVWIVCQRVQGEAYRPITFNSMEEATNSADILEPILRPPADAVQQYYFNTQHCG